MKKRFQFVHAAMVSLLICGTLLHAGITGKISGEVFDQETQDALIGANIVVEGTSLGAASGADGFFNILNIPPGTYTVKAMMMGYKTVAVEQVRVSIDQTSRVDFSLTPTVVETDETVTIVAERPLVKPDMTSSLASVSSEEIEALPVSDMSDVLAIQAGVVRGQYGQMYIRGGRSGEVAYWVDGVATTDKYSGGMGVTVENAAIQELQVVSGTYNAEYGQAMSGIVNVITKEGGKKYTGDFMAYVGDYVSNGDEWHVLTGLKVVEDPDKASGLRAVGIKKNPLADFNPVYNTEFNLSGPVPLFGDRLTFFTNARYQSTENWVYGSRWFIPQGYPSDSTIVPMNPYWRISGQGKLTWRINPSIKLSYNVFYNQWENERANPGLELRSFRYNPDGLPKQKGSGLTHIVAWNHVLSQNTFYELRFTRFDNEYEHHVLEDPLASCDYLVSVYEDTSKNINAFIFDEDDEDAQAQWDKIKDNGLSYHYIVDPDGSMGYVHQDSLGAPAANSYLNSGMSSTNGAEHFKRTSGYWIAKLDLTSQMHKAHQLKAGVEARLHEMTLNQFNLKEKLDTSGKPIDPYEPMIPETSTIFHHKYNRKPIEFSAYIQDKIELKEINLNIGVRFDYFDANTLVPVDPHDPNIYMPFNEENIYKDWVDPPEDATEAQRQAHYKSYEGKEYTPEERKAFMLEETEVSYAISPRLGIAYPITDRGVIHFSYGHFFQIPDFQRLYSNPYFKLSESGADVIFGNPALRPERTVQYEIGLQQQLTTDIGVDVTLFYKDIRDWVGTSPLIITDYGPSVKYSQYENKEYANVRGVTIKLEKRYSYHFSAGLDYSFQIAEGTYSNPDDAFTAIQANQEPIKNIVPLDWDQNHTLNGRIVTHFGTWTASLIGRYWTGRPFTPQFAQGERTGPASNIGLKENSARLPNQKSVDLYLKKRIKLSGIHINLFMNIYNLFDSRDETTVYADTGTAEYTTTVRPDEIPYDPNRVGSLNSYVVRPEWYTAPRQIQVGFSLGF
ncbi:TonB-dependent receptor [bacterium]|nr:TonB-dependent receptor [bacterium]